MSCVNTYIGNYEGIAGAKSNLRPVWRVNKVNKITEVIMTKRETTAPHRAILMSSTYPKKVWLILHRP